MIAIDTNVLVRVLVNDPQADTQCQLARELLKANDAMYSFSRNCLGITKLL